MKPLVGKGGNEFTPSDGDQLFSLGVASYSQGRHQEAEQLFLKAIAIARKFEYYFGLALVLQTQGALRKAVDAYQECLELRPDHHEALNNMGLALQGQRLLDAAADAYRRALAVKPDFPEALSNLGIVLQAQGQTEQAIAAYGAALEINPTYPEALTNLASALEAQGMLEQAIEASRKALEIRPNDPGILLNLGNALNTQGQAEEAIFCYRRALEIHPASIDALNNLGAALRTQKRFEAAVDALRKALAITPDHPQALNNLGAALIGQGHLDEAVRALRKATRLKPDHTQALNNLGVALNQQGEPERAAAAFREALTVNPDHVNALYNLGLAHQDLNRPEQAVDAFRAALHRDPNHAGARSKLANQLRHACDWTSVADEEQRVLDHVRQDSDEISPFALLACPAAGADDHLRCARNAAVRCDQPRTFHHAPRPAGRKIRIGYLSADLHEHATAYLMAELFERHDRARFDIQAYSYGPDDGSAMRRRLAATFDSFVDIRALPHREAAERIFAAEVDILVDLKGFTKDARTEIVAFRPAPIQVNYLGYPGTMGAPFIDYVIGDPVVTPMDHQDFYSERIVQLPHCYQPNDTRRAIAEGTPSRAECGLPERGFVFCCFNNTYKITPRFFDVWMRLLGARPGSVLWLLEANDAVKANLRREAAARGIAPDRLVFAPRVPLDQHLARHRLAGLFLDSLPYNAHTTASDALWTGLPVLTFLGTAFAGRVAASLLTAIGLPELITRSIEDYEALALALSEDDRQLAAIRTRLEQNRHVTPLFDIAGFALDLEAAYSTMWARWCAGEAPAAFAVAADRRDPPVRIDILDGHPLYDPGLSRIMNWC